MKKNFSLILIAVFTMLFTIPTFSQELPKEVEKEWKDKLKAFYNQYKKDLGGFKQFIEDKDAVEAQVPKLKSEVERLKSKYDKNQDEIANLNSEINLNEMRLKQLKEEGGNGSSGGSSGGGAGVVPTTGIAFTVELGSSDAGMKYIIGIFDNYPQAQTMRDSLRKMGVKDAFIIAYKDGTQVPVTEAMDGAGQP